MKNNVAFNCRYSLLSLILLLWISGSFTEQIYGQPDTFCGQAAITCFPGISGNNISTNPVLGIVDIRDRSAAAPGALWTAAGGSNIYHPSNWNVTNLGLVFGLAIGGDNNVYTSATTVYGCQTGNFNPFGPAGPAGVYKVNPVDGSIQTFITTGAFSPGTNQIPNSGSGLGNICYDRDHDQFFVTNFSDGMIYRISAAGIVLDRFDPFSSNNTPSTDNANFVALGERPWGIAYNHVDGRLYYSNWKQDRARRNAGIYNEIWSVALTSGGSFDAVGTSGTFAGGDVKEIDLPDNIDKVNPNVVFNYSSPVSDITFSESGDMLLAERSISSDCGVPDVVSTNQQNSYAHNSRVLEYYYSNTNNLWQLSPGHSPQNNGTSFIQNLTDLKFLIGIYTNPSSFGGIGANSGGGIDYGYSSYQSNLPNPDFEICDAMVWSSADFMQNNCSVNSSTWYYGLQGLNSTGGNQCTSYLIDYDGIPGPNNKNQQGDVEIFKCLSCPTSSCELDLTLAIDTSCTEKIFNVTGSGLTAQTDVYWTLDNIWFYSGVLNENVPLSNLPDGNYTVCASASDGICQTEACMTIVIGCPPCQSPDFLNLYGDDLNNVITKIEQHNNALFVLGYRTTTDPDVYATFIKMDLTGNIIWKTQLPASYRMHDFIKADDGFILVGATQPFDNSSKSLICRIDGDGTLIWSKEYNFANRERLTRIASAPSSGSTLLEFYVLGETVPPFVFNQDDVILLKIDENGNELFRKLLDYSDEDDQLGADFLRLQNGKYVFMGSKASSALLGVMNETGTSAFFAGEGSSGHFLYDGIEANEKVYLVGKTATTGFILVLNQAATTKVARYTLPSISAAYRIQADNDGNLYVSGISNDPFDNGLPLIYKLTESFPISAATSLAVEWVKGINNYESAYGFANITITDNQKLIYADNRQNAPGSFGGHDALIGVFDLNMGGECVVDTFTHTISAPEIIELGITESFNITNQTFPTPTTFVINTDFEYQSVPLPCAPVPCDTITPCNEPPIFLSCPQDVQLQDNSGSCDNPYVAFFTVYFPCEDITITDIYFPNGEVTFMRSDGAPIEAPYPIGQTTVTATATASNGLMATCVYIVTVLDVMPPVFLDCPAGYFETALPGQTQVSIDTPYPIAIDDCSNVTVVCDFFDDQNWPCGTTLATCVATDGAGNTAVCSFNVEVVCPNDCLPVFQNCQDYIYEATIDNCDAFFDCAEVIALDGCTFDPVPVQCARADGAAPGDPYPIGTTMVLATATGNNGETTTCEFTITVVDNNIPTINCPTNITIDCDEDTSPANTGLATGIDNCSIVDIIFSDVSTQTFGCDEHNYTITRTWSATDASGNSSNCVQIITVEDTTPPLIFCPSNITIGCDDDTSPANTDLATAIDNCSSNASVEIITSDVSTQGTGTSEFNYNITRTWIAIDACGNSSECTQIITVEDNMPPTIISCPSDITICEAENGQTIYNFTTPLFADNCTSNNNLTITCNPPSGSVFPLGTTTVTCTATDQSGNTSAPCTFEVTVEECNFDNCCDDPVGFCNRFDQGFTIGLSECELFITPVALDSCDLITIYWGDGTFTEGEGGDTLSHVYTANSSFEYGLTYIVRNFNPDGTPCQIKDTTWTTCIDPCNTCENATFGKIWTLGMNDFLEDISNADFVSSENRFGLATNGSEYFVAGAFNNTTNFGGGNSFTSQGGHDIFFGKYASDGTLLDMYTAGGITNDVATEIVLDNDGNIYIGGYFKSASITLPSASPGNPITLTNANVNYELYDDIFIAKYSPAFELLWAKNYSGISEDKLFGIDVDANGAVAIVGWYSWYPFSFGNPTPSLPDPYRVGAYVAKFDTNGNPLWNFGLHSPDNWDAQVRANGVGFDDAGNIYVLGTFSDLTDFNPLGTSEEHNTCVSCNNLFLAKYNSANGHLIWLVDVGPSNVGNINPYGIEVANGKIYITGESNSIIDPVNFAPNGVTPGSTWTDFDLLNIGTGSNGFLAKYDAASGTCDWALDMYLNGVALGLDVDADGNVAMVGYHFTNTDFDPSPDSEFFISSNGRDGFLAKYNTNGEFITAFAISGSGTDVLHEVVSDSDGNMIVIGHHTSSNLDDDPSPYNTEFLNAGSFGDLFIGKYDCSCTAEDADCCDNVSVSIEETADTEDCCYNISLQNDLGISIVRVQINLNTEDWVINQAALTDGYELTNTTDDQLVIEHESGALPGGFLEDVITICLASDAATPPDVQELEIAWIVGGNPANEQLKIHCRDTVTTTGCAMDSETCTTIVISDEPTCLPDSYNEYTFELSVTNQSMVDASVMIINNLGTNFTMVPCGVPSQYSSQHTTYSFMNGLAPGETEENICIKIIATEHLFEPTEFCFTTTLEGSGAQTCCTEVTEICVTVEPCCYPCESISVISEPWAVSQDCCYEIDIANDCYPDFFTRIDMESLTEGVIFDNIQNGDQLGWNFSVNNNQSVSWYPNSPYISRGDFNNVIRFCLNGIQNSDQMPQDVSFKWYIENPDSPEGPEVVYCSDNFTYNCSESDTLDCLQVAYNSIECLMDEEAYELTFTVFNNSNPPFDFAQINLNSVQGVYVLSSPIIFPNQELESGQSEEITVKLFYPIFPFPEDNFEFEVAVKDIAGDTCCAEFQNLVVPVPNPCIVSTSEVLNKEDLLIYPNPFTQSFTILFGKPIDQTIQLQLRDLYGRVIYSEQIKSGSKLLEVQTNDLASGVYFLEFKDMDGNVAVRKMIKI